MKYIANQSVGAFKTGEEVTGLTKERADELLAIGVIYATDDEPPKTKGKGKKDEPVDDEPSE